MDESKYIGRAWRLWAGFEEFNREASPLTSLNIICCHQNPESVLTGGEQ
jgi:hypothetical protein